MSLEKRALLVLGMHRSGTSSVGGTLVSLGAAGPKSVAPSDANNQRGYFESLKINRLNDEFLASIGSVWHDWREIGDSWNVSPAASKLTVAAKAVLSDEFGEGDLPMIKDPRICRMAPMWIRALEELDYSVRVVLPIRSPLEVARSLRLRNGFSIGKGLLLWLRHVLDSERACRNLPRAVLNWPDFLADWSSELSRISQQIGVSWPQLSDQRALEIHHFLSSTLRHQVSNQAELALHPDVDNWVLVTHRSLLKLVAEPYSDCALQELDEVRVEFNKASKCFGLFIAELEQLIHAPSTDKFTLERSFPLTSPKSRSQHGEDIFIARLLPSTCDKVVVDVGANDGFSWSNSYYFSELGYKLLLIEPMPTYAQLCRRLHAMNPRVFVEEYAISDAPGTATFYINLDTEKDLLAMGSSLRKEVVPSNMLSEVDVMTVPLSFLLDKHDIPNQYAVLSIDAEGVDLKVLQTANLDMKRPRVICVEEGIDSEKIRAFLEEKGYSFIEKLGPNGIYVPIRD